MPKLLLVITLALVANAEKLDPVLDQLLLYKETTKGPVGIMTTSAGAPIEKQDTETTLNKNLLADEFFVDVLTHFVRERIPVRPVHPKGAGAFGYFKLTKDMSNITRAEFLNGVGKITPIASRLSMGATERGGSDLTREPKGFSVKFYTTEGNFDISGFNTPVFVFKEPTLFTPFGHVMRKNPATDIRDLNMVWDFITLHPESLLIFLYVFSDEGITDGYRNMPGHSIHTYPLYNTEGKLSYGRFHFIPKDGIKYLNSSEAARLGAANPDYCAQDLYEAIATGDYPTWKVYMQIMSDEQYKNSKIDPFDVTKEIPRDEYEWTEVGEMVLNRAPKNYFAEVEQMAYCPGNLVPGIMGPPDKTYEARRFSYRDSARYRLGPNFDKIPVNFPYRSKFLTYNRDGLPPTSDNGLDMPNYYPNSYNGPEPYVDKNRPTIKPIHEQKANNFAQARNYYTNSIVGDRRIRLVENICDNLCGAANFLQDRAVKLFRKVHDDLSNRVAKLLKKRNCKT